MPFNFPSGLSLLRDAKIQKAGKIAEWTHGKVAGTDFQQFCDRLRDCQELSLDAMLEYQPPDFQAAGKRLIADRLYGVKQPLGALLAMVAIGSSTCSLDG